MFGIAQIFLNTADRSSVVVFLTASGFLGQKAPELMKKGWVLSLLCKDFQGPLRGQSARGLILASSHATAARSARLSEGLSEFVVSADRLPAALRDL